MDSQSIIKEIARNYGVKPSQVVKLMDGTETYQMGNKRFIAIPVETLDDKMKEVIPNMLHTIVREIEHDNFFNYARNTLTSPKEKELFKIVCGFGQDGNQFLLGLIKDMTHFTNKIIYHLGHSFLLDASQDFETVANGVPTFVFILNGEFPTIEEDAIPLAAPIPSPASISEFLRIEDIPF